MGVVVTHAGRNRRATVLVAIASLILLLSPPSRGEDLPPQSTSPTSRPAANPDQMRQWFAQLDNPVPKAREQARIALMGLRRTDLPVLLDVVKQAGELAPNQRAALHDIVMQAYLSGEPYRGNPQLGFLGVRLGESSWAALLQQQQLQQQQFVLPAPQPPPQQRAAVDAGNDNKDDEESPNAPPLGVVVTDRLPGFSSFRMLRDGDVIIGCEEQPRFEIRGTMDLKTVVGTASAGSVLHFNVYRGGRLMTVPVMIHARPGNPAGNGIEFDFTIESDRRQAIAEDYWQKTFAPVVKDQDDDDSVSLSRYSGDPMYSWEVEGLG